MTNRDALTGATQRQPRTASDRFNDPLLDRQWYLHNHGQTGGTPGMDLNVLPVWEDYTGAGIRVAVVDDGIDYNHVDLNDNYDRESDYDADQEIDDASPVSEFDNHGTAVAGIIAGEANNGEGGVGVAFGSTISGVRLNFEGNDYQRQDNNAFRQLVNFDVANNSWGYNVLFEDNFNDDVFSDHQASMQFVVDNGRDGLGTVMVFAAGNGRQDGDDSNAHNLTNSRHVIAVGALTHTGEHTNYSSPGANLLVSAFGGNSRADAILTTDRTGAEGYVDGDYGRFGGTSAAAPMVSGVVALMLEANSDLGYRDVQEILAYSARRTDADNASWQFNGATNWNGGGLHTSRDYGFGLVDAHAAVRLAETWTMQSTSHNEWYVEGSQVAGDEILDNTSIESQVTLEESLTIDHIEVEVNLTHERLGDLELILISPSGTESILMARPGQTDDNPNGSDRANLQFTFGSTQFWGEDAAGTWTLKVRDRATGKEGVLEDWSLRAYGDLPNEDSTYIYTNEYANVGDDGDRNILRDTLGYDTLNAAAVTSDLHINLTAGSRSLVAGQGLQIARGSLIEAAIGGDGNDQIRGNGTHNNLYGMRGDDRLRGFNGEDWLVGGKGDDWIAGGNDDDMLSGGAGRDHFYFSGRRMGTDTIIDFKSGQDKILLEEDTFSALFNGIGDSFVSVRNDRAAYRSSGVIIYSQSSGKLFYNTDGRVPDMGDGGHFATLSGAPSLSANDFALV